MHTILIVDDNPGDRELASFALDEVGDLRIIHANDGREGADAIEKEAPDLVLTDLRMPLMDGLELVTHIKNTRPMLPVILMTSDGSEEIAVEALHNGAASYVSKNMISEVLADTVRQVLAVARADKHRDYIRSQIKLREMSFEIENDPDLIPPLISYLLDDLERIYLGDPADRMPVGMALQEALHNALYHGNLELSSELRENDISDYFNLADERRKLLPYSQRTIHIEVRETPQMAEFRIRDEGPGFDPNQVPDPTTPENMERVSGRGLLLIRTFMDQVTHSDRGNEITLVKYRSDDASGEPISAVG